VKLVVVERPSATKVDGIARLQASNSGSDSATDKRSGITGDPFVEIDQLHGVAV
jgi:hypothetical protein